jgi:hypothetical protein
VTHEITGRIVGNSEAVPGCRWRNIAITLIDPSGGVLSVIACLQQLAVDGRSSRVFQHSEGTLHGFGPEVSPSSKCCDPSRSTFSVLSFGAFGSPSG